MADKQCLFYTPLVWGNCWLWGDIGGLGERSPGAEPLVRGSGERSPQSQKLKAFCFTSNRFLCWFGRNMQNVQ